MPRYFFDVSDGDFIKDEIGSDATDTTTIRSKAVDVAALAMEAASAAGDDPRSVLVFVRDETDRRVLTVRPTPHDERS